MWLQIPPGASFSQEVEISKKIYFFIRSLGIPLSHETFAVTEQSYPGMEILHAVVINELRWCWVLSYSILLLPLLLSCFYPDLFCEFFASFSHIPSDCMIRAASSQLLVFVICLHVMLAHILES